MIAAALLLAAAPVPDPSFEAIIRNGIAQADDQFATSSAVPPLSSSIVRVPLADNAAVWPSPLLAGYYLYKVGVLRLAYSFDRQSNIMDVGSDLRRKVEYWSEVSVWSRVKPVGTFTGQNAFGASARVSNFERHTVKFKIADVGGIDRQFRRAEMALPPSEARQLANVAALELTLADPADISAPAHCETSVVAARVDRPIRLVDTVCTVPVRVTGIRLVRTDTGAEIPTVPLRP